MAQDNSTCARSSCNCSLGSSRAVERNGQRYCSQGCADDRGCDHAACNCGSSRSAKR